jgi:hypothetical protein
VLAVLIEPGLTVFPRIAWRWEPETDILTGSYRTAGRGETADSVEVSSPEGAVLVLDVVEGDICGLDVVIWPDVDTVTALRAPAPRIAGRVSVPALAEGMRQVETALAVTVDGSEQTFHLRLGSERPVTVVQVADHFLIEVDETNHVAGFWLTGVPPFPTGE